jgi:hypothetical protein
VIGRRWHAAIAVSDAATGPIEGDLRETTCRVVAALASPAEVSALVMVAFGRT